MFDKSEIRLWIGLVWLICFLIFMIIFNYVLLPKESFSNQISQIEKNIDMKDWEQANRNVEILENIWEKHKVIIQINNATDEVITFEQLLSQLRTLVSMKKKESITSAGRLKEAGKSITKIFPSP